jgi:hypothetical protein
VKFCYYVDKKKGDRAGCGDVSTVYEAISLHMCLS